MANRQRHRLYEIYRQKHVGIVKILLKHFSKFKKLDHENQNLMLIFRFRVFFFSSFVWISFEIRSSIEVSFYFCSLNLSEYMLIQLLFLTAKKSNLFFFAFDVKIICCYLSRTVYVTKNELFCLVALKCFADNRIEWMLCLNRCEINVNSVFRFQNNIFSTENNFVFRRFDVKIEIFNH